MTEQTGIIAHKPGARCVLPEQVRTQHSGEQAGQDPQAAVFLCGTYRSGQDAHISIAVDAVALCISKQLGGE